MDKLEGFNKREVPKQGKKTDAMDMVREVPLGPGGLEVKEKAQAAICCLCHSPRLYP